MKEQSKWQWGLDAFQNRDHSPQDLCKDPQLPHCPASESQHSTKVGGGGRGRLPPDILFYHASGWVWAEEGAQVRGAFFSTLIPSTSFSGSMCLGFGARPHKPLVQLKFQTFC